MSHGVNIRLVGDEQITIMKEVVNIHDIAAVIIDARGIITDVYLEPKDNPQSAGWLSKKEKP